MNTIFKSLKYTLSFFLLSLIVLNCVEAGKLEKHLSIQGLSSDRDNEGFLYQSVLLQDTPLRPDELQLITTASQRWTSLEPSLSISISHSHLILSLIASLGLSFDSLKEHCESRAHWISYNLELMGIVTEKIWVFGDLFPESAPQIHWTYHVAPIITLEAPSGLLEKKVIDPALSDRLLTQEEWLSLIGHYSHIFHVRFSSSRVYAPDFEVEDFYTQRYSELALQETKSVLKISLND